MRVIIDCDPSDFDAAVRLLREEFHDWERRYSRPGWGWSFPLAGGRCFIRGIKGGLSLKRIAPAAPQAPPATPDGSPHTEPAQAGEHPSSLPHVQRQPRNTL